ncbi:hypothetical protein L484_019149 [Morus notabilis]|uniref:Uncharacterized protein n=1 Tax=Morus notabilis TaxID=981085 RepID=W9R4W1_9ROSA|nr:hypothetical protein L484_019149 [Morus notabilis]
MNKTATRGGDGLARLGRLGAARTFRYDHCPDSIVLLPRQAWTRFVKDKALKPGDLVIFYRHPTDGKRLFFRAISQSSLHSQPNNQFYSTNQESWNVKPEDLPALRARIEISLFEPFEPFSETLSLELTAFVLDEYWSTIGSFPLNLPLLQKLVADAKKETEVEKFTKKIHEGKKFLEIIREEISALRHLQHLEDERKVDEARRTIEDGKP